MKKVLLWSSDLDPDLDYGSRLLDPVLGPGFKRDLRWETPEP